MKATDLSAKTVNYGNNPFIIFDDMRKFTGDSIIEVKEFGDVVDVRTITVEEGLLLFIFGAGIEGFGISDHVFGEGVSHVVGGGIVVVLEFILGKYFFIFILLVFVLWANVKQT